MKIFIPILGFGRSGGFRVLSQLANQWILMGNDVTFISVADDLKSEPYYPTNAKILHINRKGKETTMPTESVIIGHVNRASLTKRFAQLNSLRLAINIHTTAEDIILATYSLTAYSVFYSKQNKHKFYYIQAYEPEYFSDTFYGRLMAKIVSKTYSLKLNKIVNSPIYFSYKNLKAKLSVYPGIDFNIFNNKLKNIEQIFENRPIVIGCIGRIDVVKGTKYVVEAYQILKERGVHCELHMAVFGNDAMLNKDIVAITPKNDLELAAYYQSIDVLVAPGTSQFGAVHYPVIEAMACGTAVITTAYHPAHPDNAWITPPFSGIGIADQIQLIIKNPNLALYKSKKALTDVQHLSWPNVATEMLKMFQPQ